MIVNFLLIVPLLTVLTLLLVKNEQYIKPIALVGSFVQLLVIIGTLIQYLGAASLKNNGAMLLQTDVNWFAPLHIHYHIGVDGISMVMLLLTALIVIAAILVSWKEAFLQKEFFILLILLSFGAYGFFIAIDLFLMFFFLEIAVVPKFLLILIWGSGKKAYSATKLVLMLIGASALLFMGIVGIYYNQPNGLQSLNMLQIAQMQLPYHVQLTFFPFLFIGFGVFTALFPFHTWVPDGHPAAPTAGSMFLAGISMKLGGYGLLRLVMLLMPAAAQFYAPYIILLAAIGILYGAFATMVQKDLKYMNAYSSISHCGFVLLGIGMLTPVALTGAVLQMVSHGLMTALFFAAIGMIYSRTHTRIIEEMGGLLVYMPFISGVFILAGLASLGLPGLSGFTAEMTVLVGSWQQPVTAYRVATIVAAASIVITAVYVLRAIGTVLMGKGKIYSDDTPTDARWYEKWAGIILVLGILVVGIMPFLLLKLISPSILYLPQSIFK
ncbi:MAG: NADH-quinone oxidoreductase subunit M [Sphingobacteriales bacterium]|uniref:complex I subunit 4 family protein n=1 Tax=Hydrotalea flava TaxID=714549 RepID=UPI000836139B|nr:NADH-quinone oxidoreductase subunit M [Hydrotalea flava]RTL51528.1 MAG: NADH-quinone oxidoreductase subunit M [Sphingobacteriales bacterium]